MKKSLLGVLLVFVPLVAAAQVANPSTTPPPPPTTTGPATPKHIVMVIEENRDFNQVVGSMPYLNSLASQYSLLTGMYANTHPSIGNYFELTTGNIVTNDNKFTTPLVIDNIAMQIEKKGLTWKAYAEDLPSVGYRGRDVKKYVKRHNPFAYFSNVNQNNIVPFSQFAADTANGTLPNFAFVVPNNGHNGHDGTLATADAWLKTNASPLFAQAQFKEDGLLIVTFDEADTDKTNGGGKIYTVFAGQNVKMGFQSSAFYQSQNLLKTINGFLGLPSQGDAVSASAITDVFK
jgi:phospholipase C